MVAHSLPRYAPKSASHPKHLVGAFHKLGKFDVSPPKFNPLYIPRPFDGSEILRDLRPPKSSACISTYCNNRGFPDIAIPVGDAGENNDLAFLGGFRQNGPHEV